jgi:hypothetical protein
MLFMTAPIAGSSTCAPWWAADGSDSQNWQQAHRTGKRYHVRVGICQTMRAEFQNRGKTRLPLDSDTRARASVARGIAVKNCRRIVTRGNQLFCASAFPSDADRRTHGWPEGRAVDHHTSRWGWT